MQVTIEEIGGQLCTVIKKPFDAEWVKEQLDMGIPVVVELDGQIKWVIIREKEYESYDALKYIEYSGCTWHMEADSFKYTLAIIGGDDDM